MSHLGIVDAHSVSHQDRECTRSVSVLHCIAARDQIPGMAGTQHIDQDWWCLKREMPERGLGGRAEADRNIFRTFIRAAQWRRIIGMVDRWQAFCLAVKRHREKQPK